MKNRGVLLLTMFTVLVLGGAMLCMADDPEVPFGAEWASSGHADSAGEAFIHWDEDDPAEVAAGCAKCHSTYGYHDFLGIDGTDAGVVDANAPIGTTVECVACHNEATIAMDSVVMPSGLEIEDLGAEARCMQCHQGRESTVSVNARIESAGVTDDDVVSDGLGFRNVHYFAAAATQYGTLAQGGYQYAGKTYDTKFAHVEGYDTCNSCHDPHTLEVKVDECSVCHIGTAEVRVLRLARLSGSLVDYDGDGDVSEGVYYEIKDLQAVLYEALQAYSTEFTGGAIVYDAHSYPYWFDEAGGRYGSWTARLVKATYNYQFSLKDPGAFAHGGKYVIQLLYDSIEDLNSGLSEPIDMSLMHREDVGHFAGSTEAWRHWDEDGEVSSGCAKCHSATGLPFYLELGVNQAEPLSNGMLCSTCHDTVPGYTRYAVDSVEFPSGLEASFGEGEDANLCLNCHQGRESTVSVNARIASASVASDDTVSSGLSFRNIHYFAAGATLFGNDVQGAYQYDGQSYLGQFAHVRDYSDCTECHDSHDLEVKVDECAVCHQNEDLATYRMGGTDYDGDGDTAEGIAGEIDTLAAAVYTAMQEYASDVLGGSIVYDAHSYPYWFDDAGGRYGSWTSRLLKAAFNYQYFQKDPGGYAHNGMYLIQILYDTLVDLGADVRRLVRP
ncbi:hypothetical protein ACFLSW_01020 [Candidatus Bipolaricaulota bacterium]